MVRNLWYYSNCERNTWYCDKCEKELEQVTYEYMKFDYNLGYYVNGIVKCPLCGIIIYKFKVPEKVALSYSERPYFCNNCGKEVFHISEDYKMFLPIEGRYTWATVKCADCGQLIELPLD